ncbi:UNVERIFIED_CONTAM: Pentatricopeptide repeat-containing protein, mitochondrial [Sesamum calycinum]|uniref:Pentatricopeptide repeat-containing protein, mitochondrial n=1 Tax=Sesamum calycinum TaxID=2727403 RepID=A0AAW2NC60_9LAMI
MMAAMELKKKPGYSCVDLGKENQVFYAGETMHPMKDEIFGLLKELDTEMRKRGYVPDTSLVLHDMEPQEKERQLFWHSERLAVAYGLLKSAPGTSIRILKNLRICGDCHTVLKFICSMSAEKLLLEMPTDSIILRMGVLLPGLLQFIPPAPFLVLFLSVCTFTCQETQMESAAAPSMNLSTKSMQDYEVAAIDEWNEIRGNPNTFLS